ncbi:MAG: arginine--tRNA ligase [DPANN group archaeon]|nr:arginine--tRNA ligase [DPANN group archaeon]
MDTKQEVVKLLSKAAGLKESEVSEILEVPPNLELGDYAMPCFKLAAKLKKAPQIIAKEISAKTKTNETVREVKATGPYVNIFLNTGLLAENTISNILTKKEMFGESKLLAGKKVLIEFSGLNPNKPGHIGNARNTCLGDSLSRILAKCGANTIKMDYINDMGVPTAAVFWAIKNKRAPDKKQFPKLDHWQGDIYVSIKKLMDEKPEINKSVHELLAELESNKHPKLNEEQRELIEECVKAQYETWSRLNAFHDIRVHESDVVFSGLFDFGLKKLKQSGKLVKAEKGDDKDCYVIPLSQFDYFKGMLKPDKILIRPDGTATYTGKDVMLQMWKFGILPDLLKYKKILKQRNGEELYATWPAGKPEKNRFNSADFAIHIVGAEQKYVMQVDYYAMKALNYEKEFQNSYHFAYGLVGFGGESKISSREGAAGLTADKILNTAVDLAKKEVDNRNKELPEKMKQEIAEKIGVCAVRYYLVRFSPEAFIQFDWDKVVNFEGDTGPYLQYALVRAKKIIAKAGRLPNEANFNLLQKAQEFELVKKMSAFSEVVEKAGKEYAPNLVANYAFDLANTFSTFYEACPVIAAESEGLRNVRLKLVQAFAQVLRNALYLLGIEEVEVM